jgi:hypothetical protein
MGYTKSLMRSRSRRLKSLIPEALPGRDSEALSRMVEGKQGNAVNCLEALEDEKHSGEEDSRPIECFAYCSEAQI